MRLPSVRTLSQITTDPGKLREILESDLADSIRNDPYSDSLAERYPLTVKWVRSCYHLPTRHDIKMRLADEHLGTYGVEAFKLRDGSIVEYCNAGDSYAGTLVAVGKPGWFGQREWSYRVASWGDIAERHAVAEV